MTGPDAPAIAVWEFGSIVDGIHAADAIAKASPVQRLLSGTIHPGRYVVLVSGDTASVAVALEAVDDLGVSTVDVRFLPDVAVPVAGALGPAGTSLTGGEAVGVVETTTAAACVDAADAGVKAAAVDLAGLHLADGLGGKAYLVYEGSVGDVGAAVEAAADRAGDQLVNTVVIPQVTDDLRADLVAADRFLDRMSGGGVG